MAPVRAERLGRVLLGGLLALAVLLAGVRAGEGAKSGADGVDEYTLKAAFLSKFVRFVTWPSERLGEKDALVIAVLGEDPFGKRLDETFEKRKEDERKVKVRRLQKLEDLDEVHVLFLPDGEIERLKEVLEATREAGVLLVGESPELAARGASINFYTEADKVRFEINPEAAKRQKLKISSDLLKHARIVKDKEPAKE